MNKLLSFYHPSTAVFVDDQQGFLTALKYRLSPTLPVIFYNNPLKALERIENHPSLQKEKLRHLFQIDDQLPELTQEMSDTYIGLKLDEICRIANDANRFHEQSVVIVDYMMPDLDGISFCRRLKKHPIKKIMLTGNKDHSMAVQAFNEGIIDHFLVKDSPNLIDQLVHTIDKMQKSYFSSLMENRLGDVFETIVPFFNNIAIVQFYENLMKELNAVEFYLLDRWGSVMFITYEGIPITLIISTEQVIESYASIAEDQNEIEIAGMLLRRDKLIYFPSKLDLMKPASSWKSFLFDATKFPEQPGIYYSIIHDQSLQPLSVEQIKSQKIYSNK
jgi:CheY-like chemotaxis protein